MRKVRYQVVAVGRGVRHTVNEVDCVADGLRLLDAQGGDADLVVVIGYAHSTYVSRTTVASKRTAASLQG